MTGFQAVGALVANGDREQIPLDGWCEMNSIGNSAIRNALLVRL